MTQPLDITASPTSLLLRLCRKYRKTAMPLLIGEHLFTLREIFPFSYRPSLTDKLHQHACYEMSFVLAGAITDHYSLTYPFGSRHAYLRCPYVSHGWLVGDEPVSILAVGFNVTPHPASLAETSQIHRADVYADLTIFFQEIADELPGWQDRAHWRLALIFAQLFNLPYATPPRQTRQEHTSESNATIARLEEFLQANCASSLDIPCIADYVGMSPRSLERFFARNFGTSPLKWLTVLRITRAVELLDNTDLPVGEIARQVGFLNTVHFCRKFKAIMLIAPGAYRRSRLQTIQEA